MNATVYLIPTVLSEDVLEPIPAYVLSAVLECSVFYVENERTARRRDNELEITKPGSPNPSTTATRTSSNYHNGTTHGQEKQDPGGRLSRFRKRLGPFANRKKQASAV